MRACSANGGSVGSDLLDQQTLHNSLRIMDGLDSRLENERWGGTTCARCKAPVAIAGDKPGETSSG